MLETVSHRVVLAWGWRRAALATVAGAVGALAQAPLNWFPALWVSLPLLVWLIDGAVEARSSGALKRVMPAFKVGWFFGFGYFLAGLWWIGASMTVDLAQFGWMIPIAIPGLCGFLALFFAVGAALARAFWREGPRRILWLAVALSLSEYLRGIVLTGFPWNALGYGLAANVPMMQIAAVVGLPGMTFLAVLIFAAPAALADRAGRGFVAIAAALLALIVGFGYLRLGMAASTPAFADVPGIKLRIMQPSIDQWKKWRPEFRNEIVDTYIALSRKPAAAAGAAPSDAAKPAPSGAVAPSAPAGSTAAAAALAAALGAPSHAAGNQAPGGSAPGSQGLDGVTHLIWPESAFPFLLANESSALTSIADLIGSNTILITGAIRAEAPAAGETATRYYNSVFAIGAGATLLAAYDKVHLVPFGEYLPFQDLLESIGLRQLTHLRGGFSAGPGRRTLHVPGTPPFAALVCYEAIFSGQIVDEADRPAWLVNVTNDGWFGVTPGPWQHLAQARLRAVEEGLPLVRAANTGVSAVIDAFGNIRAQLGLGQAGVLDSALPGAAPATPYSRYGDWVFTVLIMVAAAIAAFKSPKLSR